MTGADARVGGGRTGADGSSSSLNVKSITSACRGFAGDGFAVATVRISIIFSMLTIKDTLLGVAVSVCGGISSSSESRDIISATGTDAFFSSTFGFSSLDSGKYQTPSG